MFFHYTDTVYSDHFCDNQDANSCFFCENRNENAVVFVAWVMLGVSNDVANEYFDESITRDLPKKCNDDTSLFSSLK